MCILYLFFKQYKSLHSKNFFTPHLQVEGIGPIFRIRITLENLDKLPAYSLKLNYGFNKLIYKLNNPPQALPTLIPNIPYPVDIPVECIDENGSNDTIKIYVIDPIRTAPIVAALVNMPISELKID